MNCHRPLFGAGFIVLFACILHAQTTTTPEAPAEKKQATTTSDTKVPVQSGMDRTAILVEADSDEVTTTILLRGLDSNKPAKEDLDTGLLVSTSQPTFQIHPKVTLLDARAPASAKPGEFLTDLRIESLVVFGESTAPLLYKGRQVELLRFSKPGLIAKPPTGDAFVVREGEAVTWNSLWGLNSFPGQSLLLVLENPSANEYACVRARLRFENQDVYLFTAEKFDKPAETTKHEASCETDSEWTKFRIPQYAQVSLRATPSTSWFFDPHSGLAGTAKRKGWLTLRFEKKAQAKLKSRTCPSKFSSSPAPYPCSSACPTLRFC